MKVIARLEIDGVQYAREYSVETQSVPETIARIKRMARGFEQCVLDHLREQQWKGRDNVEGQIRSVLVNLMGHIPPRSPMALLRDHSLMLPDGTANPYYRPLPTSQAVRPTSCPGCGAPVSGVQCEYCGRVGNHGANVLPTPTEGVRR